MHFIVANGSKESMAVRERDRMKKREGEKKGPRISIHHSCEWFFFISVWGFCDDLVLFHCLISNLKSISFFFFYAVNSSSAINCLIAYTCAVQCSTH